MHYDDRSKKPLPASLCQTPAEAIVSGVIATLAGSSTAGSLGRTTRVCGLARLTDESMGG
jgi:hypothetical protein